MPYAQGRTFYDADSHIMELPTSCIDVRRPDVRERAPRALVLRVGRALERQGRRGSPQQPGATAARARRAEMIALGDELIAGPKGYHRRSARSTATSASPRRSTSSASTKQLVFSTFASGTRSFYVGGRSRQLPLRRRARTQPRDGPLLRGGCAADGRRRAPARRPGAGRIAELDHAARARPRGGVGAASRRAADARRGTMPWTRSGRASPRRRMPFVLHVGGHPVPAPSGLDEHGPPGPDRLARRRRERAQQGHDLAPPHGRDLPRRPGARRRARALPEACAAARSSWAPAGCRPCCKRLDWSAEIWRKSEPELQKLARKPSEQIGEQLAFTPYPYEDVGDLIRQSDDALYLFSSDYPHFEGGRHPLGRFGASLEGHGAETLERFYSANFARMFGLAGA